MIIKRLLTGAIKIITLSFISLTFINGPAFASENIDYNVSVASSLTLTIPTSSIVLNLDPSSNTFGSEDLTISVGTNNKTGYTLTLSTPNNNTDLNRDSSGDSIVAKIETLASGTYTETTFTPDKWGYKINSNTSIPSTITTDYIPFQSGNTLMESSTAVNHDEAELTFAAKIDYLQPAGSYATQLNFNLVANPLIDYMQNFTLDMCKTVASAGDYTVVDKRDNNEYTTRYINGACWMTQNLRFTENDLTPDMSDVENNTTIAWAATDPNTNYDPYYYNSGNTTNGCWYNYAGATAMSVTSTTWTEASASICPAGWTLPDRNEIAIIANYQTEFSPVTANGYNDGSTYCPGYGRWWGSTRSASGDRPDYLCYNANTTLTPSDGIVNSRKAYVRCMLKETDGGTIDDISNMQDISSRMVENTTEGSTATLEDTRDNQMYTVKKINGQVWMTRNLAIGCNGTGSTYGSNVVAGGKTITSKNSNITTNSSWTTPTAGLDNGDSYINPYMTCSDTYGAWYNFAAASAGMIAKNSDVNIIIEDVCPKGWRLPANEEITYISGTAQYRTDFNPVAGGDWYSGIIENPGNGYWWSYETGTNVNRRRLLWDGSTMSVTGQTRSHGFYVRCIAK